MPRPPAYYASMNVLGPRRPFLGYNASKTAAVTGPATSLFSVALFSVATRPGAEPAPPLGRGRTRHPRPPSQVRACPWRASRGRCVAAGHSDRARPQALVHSSHRLARLAAVPRPQLGAHLPSRSSSLGRQMVAGGQQRACGAYRRLGKDAASGRCAGRRRNKSSRTGPVGPPLSYRAPTIYEGASITPAKWGFTTSVVSQRGQLSCSG